MSEVLSVSEETARRIAEHSIDSLKSSQNFLLQQHSDSFKWITASLLTVNSGGAFAILNTEKIDIITKKTSGMYFLVGILLAMLVGVFAQRLTARVIKILNQQVGFWLSVLEDGAIPQNLTEIEAQNSKDATRLQWIVPVIGWLSAACFVAGMFSIGANLKADSSAPSSVKARSHNPNLVATELSR